jgi:hypothetical protein
MADIFISYSKKHAQLTVDLARDLEVEGYTTWWDTARASCTRSSATLSSRVRARAYRRIGARLARTSSELEVHELIRRISSDLTAQCA